MVLLDMMAGVFEQFAVGNPAGTGRLAGAAAQAQVNVPHRGSADWQPPVLDGAHEINAPTGGIIFVAGFQIGRAGREAKTTVNAGQRLVVVEETFRQSTAFSRLTEGELRGVHSGKRGKTCFGSNSSLTRCINLFGNSSLAGCGPPR